MGFVLCVPIVFYFGELFGGVFGAEGEMALSVVGFAFCTTKRGED